MQIGDIVRLLGGEAENLSSELDICGCAKMEEATSSEVTFLANLKYTSQLENTKAGAILIGKDFVLENPLPVIRVGDPYMAFVTLLEHLHSRPQWQDIGVSQLAYIDESASVAENTAIAPGVYIGKNVVVGNGTRILPNSVILDNVEIGEDCLIYPNVTIREDCHIGNRVILQPGCVIGGDGFGFAPTKEGFHKIPQVGNVVIEDDVEIGSNSAIDRATTGSTIICAGTKIDNLVQLGHNVRVGNHTVIAGLTGIAGSTKVGNWCQIGGQVGIAGHLNISDQTKIAGNSGLMADTESGKTYFGSPVREMNQAMRIESGLNKLPELLRRVKKLEKMFDSQKENGEERE